MKDWKGFNFKFSIKASVAILIVLSDLKLRMEHLKIIKENAPPSSAFLHLNNLLLAKVF